MRATASTAQLSCGEVAAAQRGQFAVCGSAEPILGRPPRR